MYSWESLDCKVNILWNKLVVNYTWLFIHVHSEITSEWGHVVARSTTKSKVDHSEVESEGKLCLD